MPSARYREWFDAIRNKRRVCYIYQGKPRDGCPHVLGLDKDGEEKVLVHRIVPGGSQPQWRCLFVAETAIAGPAQGPWLEGNSHKQRNSCIVDVHIESIAQRSSDSTGPRRKSSGRRGRRAPKAARKRRSPARASVQVFLNCVGGARPGQSRAKNKSPGHFRDRGFLNCSGGFSPPAL